MEQADPPQEPAPPEERPPPHVFPHWTKLALTLFMLLFLVFSASVVCTFQFILIQKKAALDLYRRDKRRLQKKRDFITNTKNYISTVAPSDETKDVQLWKKARRSGTTNDVATAAQAYWNQVLPYLKEWDAVFDKNDDGVVSTQNLPAPSSHTYMALEEAARLGHAEAQYFMANALASGILPFSSQKNLSVPVDMIPLTNDRAAMQSYLYWHMAAIDGHVPSAVSLAYRRQEDSCEAALPYYEEAAHNIIDMLEMDMHSRAIVQPPMDGHVLSEIFLKGAASQLSWSNQPDEPADALRYYHMRAAANDVGAAHTLAQLHHYGLRGVAQNLTLALQYYDMAAALGHVESAGQAGRFYFWGMGLDWESRNYVKAQSLFQVGAPHGLEGCRTRFRNAQLQKQRRVQFGEEGEIDQCDHSSVNGLGLMYLFGMPLLLKRDVDKAQKYFELARDMGNMDASYNLAMMRLGWKTHFATLDSLDDSSQTSASVIPNFLKDFRVHQQPSKADYLVALQDLVTAAHKGHLQAKHRLATIYAHGVTGSHGVIMIAPDCVKALKNFQFIANNANPHLSRHTRRAYKQYVQGNWEGALRNYLVAAEMGHEVSQVNAAFLLEQGVCLSLSPQQCAAASLRLWKAAVQSNPEAALRVGDMYYYGRLRDTSVSEPGPFGWLPYLLYPERYLVPFVQRLLGQIPYQGDAGEDSNDQTCDAGEDGTCLATATGEEEEIVESDLEMAARYYRLAADVHKSPRANFNLGFLYEWGLGVKQDFPLAKRHYDLAATALSGEADIAVRIALVAMQLHERIVKFFVTYEDWFVPKANAEIRRGEQIPRAPEGGDVDHPVPPGPPLKNGQPRTKKDVIISHLLSWETFLIVALTVVLSKLLQNRPTPRQHR
jgi:SEL1 protein